MNSTDRPASAPDATAKRRIPSGYIIAAVIVAAIAIALVGRHLYYRSKINAELDAIHKAGFPVTLREWSDYYPTPQGNNAADVYSQAFAKFTDASWRNDLPLVGEGKLPPRGEPLPKEMQTAATAYLTSNAQALALLHKAAAIEECRFNIDFSMDFSQSAEGMRMPHLAPLRQAARLLELEALMKVEEGKPDEAAGAIMASLGEARSLWNEPLYNSQLVRLSVDSTSLSSLERVLSRTVLGDAQLAKISQAAASEDNPGGLLRMMVGERCEGEALTPYVKSEFRPVTYVLYKFSGMEAQDHAMYLKLMAELVSAAGGSQEDMLDRPKKVEKEMRRLPKRFVMAKMLVVAVPDAFELQLKAFARLRAARAGIAVERFRMANDRLPDSLGELLPKWLDAVPPDPFDDKPIRYKKLTKGFVTYSVGPDLKDDGGKEGYNDGYDITFIVAR